MFFLCLFRVGRGKGDEGVIEVCFEGEDVVGCICSPAVAHVLGGEGGVGNLVAGAGGEG